MAEFSFGRNGAVLCKLRLKFCSLRKAALVTGDHSLMGVVLNSLLAWPDCAFREEVVRHPHDKKDLLAHVPAVFAEDELSPKEEALIALCRQESIAGYTTYTGKRDTTSRLKLFLNKAGFKTAVLRANGLQRLHLTASGQALMAHWPS